MIYNKVISVALFCINLVFSMKRYHFYNILTLVISSGTSQSGHIANNMLRIKNGLQHSTKVKNTSPKTYKLKMPSVH
jgi:hypothetical protein